MKVYKGRKMGDERGSKKDEWDKKRKNWGESEKKKRRSSSKDEKEKKRS